MRAGVLALCGFLLTAPAFAGEDDDIQSTIRGQISAFQRDDAVSAFGFAAPGTQNVFHDADTFMAMVKRSYPVVYHPREIAFGMTAKSDHGTLQRVELTDGDGRGWTAVYMMEKQQDGSWRIQGCVLQQSGDTAI